MATEFANMQLARDTAANWTSNNPTLGSGEIGIESDTKAMKVGDGVTAWTSLTYAGAPSATAMPTSPVTGQRVWRSDLSFEFFWDGTRWLSTEMLSMSFNYLDTNATSGSDILNILPVPFLGVFDLWLESADFMQYQSGTGTWQLQITWSDTEVRNIILSSQNFTHSGSYLTDSANAIGSVLNASAKALYLYASELTGTSNCYPSATLFYRLIGT